MALDVCLIASTLGFFLNENIKSDCICICAERVVCLCSLSGRAEERFPSPVRVLCHVCECFFYLYFLLMLFVRLPLNAPSRQQYKVNSGKSSERAANSASQIPKMSSKHTSFCQWRSQSQLSFNIQPKSSNIKFNPGPGCVCDYW
jgi:hypothetical protein